MKFINFDENENKFLNVKTLNGKIFKFINFTPQKLKCSFASSVMSSNYLN